MWRYQAFGRSIDSTIRLPGVPGERARERPGRRPDELVVRRGSLPRSPAALDGSPSRVYGSPAESLEAYRGRSGVYWFAEDTGTLLVSASGRITASESTGASEGALGRFVVGPGLRTAVATQGDVVIHASAVAVDGRAVAFVGPCGSGKSTAAAACCARGHDVLADDAAALLERDGTVVAAPTSPLLSVDAAVADATGLERPGTVDVAERFASTARPLSTVYLLEDGDEFEAIDLAPTRAMYALLEAADGPYARPGSDASARHHETVASIARSVRVARLNRPRRVSRLSELAEFVEERAYSA